MIKNCDSFVFYRSFYDAISDLPDTEKLEIITAICELALNKKRIKLAGLSKTLFTLIEPQILANSKRRENGNKGGRPQKENHRLCDKKTNGYLNSKTNGFPEKKPNVNVNVNDNVNVNVNDDIEDHKNDQELTGEIPKPEIVKEWADALGVLAFSEVEKMAMNRLCKIGCKAIDAVTARNNSPEFFGKLNNEYTYRLITKAAMTRINKTKLETTAF